MGNARPHPGLLPRGEGEPAVGPVRFWNAVAISRPGQSRGQCQDAPAPIHHPRKNTSLTSRPRSANFTCMNWIFWAILSAFFAGITAILAKIGVAHVDSNLATAIRTTVVLVFSWGLAAATSPLASLQTLSRRRTSLSSPCQASPPVSPGSAIFARCNSAPPPASRRWTNSALSLPSPSPPSSSTKSSPGNIGSAAR